MRNTAFILILFFSSLTSFAQDESSEGGSGFQKEKLFVGGSFGISVGSYTFINISPQVGYRFNDFVAAGLGINGQYINSKTYYNTGQDYSKASQGVVGLNIFGRIYPINQLMIQVQPEANYVFGNETYYDISGRTIQTTKTDAKIIPSLLIGGGAVFPSGKGAFIASVFYDVLQDSRSPYSNKPIYYFTYNIGL
jgi:hypothetical protein